MQSGSNSVAGVREGDILAGKYRVERVLGIGGMGVVVAAHHIVLDEKVALKFLLPDALGNALAVARFVREARAAVRIKSEHVARVSDVGTLPNGAPYMVMEYLDGGDLAAWLSERGALPIEQAVEFVLQACVAVADAHAIGIVHRDLKPANLFCVRRSDGNLSIKVLDFGISKMTTSFGGSGPSALTHTSALMGSPLYMSPEQMRSAKDANAQADIWAIGIILFELITGKPPFIAETLPELVLRITSDPPPPIRSFRPDVPEALEAVILRCLEKDRQKRYANVAELALALLPFAPKRSKASVERISGIIQAAGLSAGALALPPSPKSGPGMQVSAVSAGTLPPVGRTTLGSGRKKGVVVGGLAGAVAVVALVGSAIFLKTAKTHREEASQATSAAPAIASASPQPPPVDSANPAETNAADAAMAEHPPVVPSTAPPPVAAPEIAATTRKKPPLGTPTPLARTPPAATTATLNPAVAGPCKLVKTLDKTGEWHFSCPCATCQ